MRALWCFAAILSLLAACQPAATPPPPSPTPEPTQTSTLTATIVWFPPTSTPTVFAPPLVTPTLETTPSAGAILLEDDFSDPDPWSLIQTSTSSVALGVNNLTLALDQPGAYLYTLRSQPSLDDFYLEITARTSLCRDRDEYGLLLRVSPDVEFYRFSLSCDGQARLDKYYQGKASAPQPWTLSGAVPPGAPASTRLAVWAQGKELSFYINNELQFTVRDPSLSNGSLGLFIRSAGENAVTVSFSDLVIYEIP